jgi:hypothetical protein
MNSPADWGRSARSFDRALLIKLSIPVGIADDGDGSGG